MKLSILFMRFWTIINRRAKKINSRLSILFMRFRKEVSIEQEFIDKIFQFSLWDSEFFSFINFIFFSLSILFMRFFFLVLQVQTFFQHFQFSLWDSEVDGNSNLQLPPLFQFSLWDSKYEFSSSANFFAFSFNSLYEIQKRTY